MKTQYFLQTVVILYAINNLPFHKIWILPYNSSNLEWLSTHIQAESRSNPSGVGQCPCPLSRLCCQLPDSSSGILCRCHGQNDWVQRWNNRRRFRRYDTQYASGAGTTVLGTLSSDTKIYNVTGRYTTQLWRPYFPLQDTYQIDPYVDWRPLSVLRPENTLKALYFDQTSFVLCTKLWTMEISSGHGTLRKQGCLPPAVAMASWRTSDLLCIMQKFCYFLSFKLFLAKTKKTFELLATYIARDAIKKNIKILTILWCFSYLKVCILWITGI